MFYGKWCAKLQMDPKCGNEQHLTYKNNINILSKMYSVFQPFSQGLAFLP